MKKKKTIKKYPITPYDVHVKGLKYDLKQCQKDIRAFKKGIKIDGFNSSSVSLEDFIEAVMQARYIIFLLKEELSGNIYEVFKGKYKWN